MGKKKKAIIIVSLVVLLTIGIVVGYTTAYFTADVANSVSTNTVVTTSRMEIEFTDGPEVKLENAMPGTSVEKTFKVKNIGDADTVYDVYMSEVVNNFVDKSDLVYTLTSGDGGKNIAETQLPDENTKIVGGQSLGTGDEHNYKIKIDFKETNDNQDDNKDKDFKITIRVNEVKDPSDSAVDVIKKINDGSVAEDNTDDHNLRYIGADPNNYVLYNDELWRIIGVMNNIQTSDGQNQSLLKIIRKDSLGYYSWDGSACGINDGCGINQWGESTYEDGTPYEGADLMRELNTDYLGNITVGTDGKWYDGMCAAKNADMPSTTLNTTAQNMMETVVWKLGANNNINGVYDNTEQKPLGYYNMERANTNGKLCSGVQYCNDTVNRTSSWTGKVALMYPSDYLYSTSGGTTTDRQSCYDLVVSYEGWGSSENSDCRNNSWLNITSVKTLTPVAHYSEVVPWVSAGSHADSVSIISYSGYLSGANAYSQTYVYPVVHLKSTVVITGGTGTQTDPYTIE